MDSGHPQFLRRGCALVRNVKEGLVYISDAHFQKC